MSEFFNSVWPWLWPTAALVALLGLTRVASTTGIRLLSQRLQVRGGKVVRRARKVVATVGTLASLFAWVRMAPFSNDVDRFLKEDLGPWFWPTLGLLVWLAGGAFLTRRLLVWLNHRARETKTKLDDALVSALGRPVQLGVFVLGVNLWSGLVPLPSTIQDYIGVGTKGAVVLLIVLFLNGLVQAVMALRAAESKLLATSGGVISTAVKVGIYLIGILMVLSTVGVDVTPLIASLGVGSLAIGLALQQTLEDFLAGLLLAADQPAKVGDYVGLESGEEGWVLSIGWRTTRIKTRDDMHIIVPNSKLAQATLTNRTLPLSEVNFTVPVGVSYTSDLAKVTEAAILVARDLLGSDGRGISRFKPRVVYTSFGESSIDFEVWLRAKTWADHFGLKSQFIVNLHKHFAEEGIDIPFPIRTLDLSQSAPIRLAIEPDGEAKAKS